MFYGAFCTIFERCDGCSPCLQPPQRSPPAPARRDTKHHAAKTRTHGALDRTSSVTGANGITRVRWRHPRQQRRHPLRVAQRPRPRPPARRAPYISLVCNTRRPAPPAPSFKSGLRWMAPPPAAHRPPLRKSMLPGRA